MPDLGAVGVNLIYAAMAALTVVMITFIIGTVIDKHRVVDIAWGIGFAAIAVTTFVLSSGHGDTTRRLVVMGATVAWGLRLAGHIAWRARGHGEDPRYEQMLSRAKGSRTAYALRMVYLLQGLSMWFISLPVQIAQYDPDPPNWLFWVGVAIWAVGLFFEAVGDYQLVRFTGNPANKGEVLDSGLWRYSRHPNYFGDATVWWGLYLMAASGGWLGAATILSPLAMNWLLAKKTGKPLLEKDMANRRPGYADYVARTSGFFPWPPKRSA
ncbi:steroid 5-alpha reductase family enzyme [Allocatelliglobosispora scoriae]|uniref:Steroid 5-alpha reductase family enzyme n=1 Tax=Allocatelliglobosispora scoriae TaxID=643052 RepID=A0A841BVH0_9ACTN|nr:DUF1295 domain-containing protein [Allocatelliglobosispora scoriae]MBB5873087.1 steroid 5-alpha reductase family enzyme [Allocatelliglobosispora scoriae]